MTTTSKRIAFDFFYANAGYSVAVGETKQRGRARSARELAQAEATASANGFTFEWESDFTCNHRKEYGYKHEPNTCETCLCRNGAGEVVASVGCVDDATREYRRVIEAELAMEALASN